MNAFEIQNTTMAQQNEKMILQTSCFLEVVNVPENSCSPTSPQSTSTWKRDQMSPLCVSLCLLFCEVILLRGELWEKDMSSLMKIGLSTGGYARVDLLCGPDHFSVNVTLGEEFRGVVYTRGSFRDKKLPCFKGHEQKIPKGNGEFFITLRIPFEKCGTVMDVAASLHTNTVVVQHDPDLIMPGDAAFSIDCAFEPEFRAEGALRVQVPTFRSRIVLVDADPSEEGTKAEDSPTAVSDSDRVTFTAPKDEL